MRNRKRTGWHRVINGVNISAFFVVAVRRAAAVLADRLQLQDAGRAWGTARRSTSRTRSAPRTTTRPSSQYDFGIYFRNSLIVTLVATALVLIVGTMAGYALGRLPMRGKFTLMVTLLIISVFPAIAVIAPLYLLLRNLGWLNSYQGLILVYTAFNLPFAIWILRNYMLGIPKEMEETGRIDGAGPIRTVWTIILPMALPGVFTAGIFCFTACWTEFLMALTFNSANNYRTIPVGIAKFGTVLHGPVRDHLRRQRGGGGAHRHPGLHLPQVRDLRPDLGRGEGMSSIRQSRLAPGKESSWPR